MCLILFCQLRGRVHVADTAMVAHGVIYKLINELKLRHKIHNFKIFPYPFSHPFLVVQ